MANTREIRRRIRSVENTAKITNAIQLVAASKMRRAQDRALQARPYAEKMQAVLGHLSGVAGDPETAHPLLDRRDVNETTVILITPDRGLCGGLIANLERHTGEIVLGPEAGGSGDISMIPVGRKGGDYFQRFGLISEPVSRNSATIPVWPRPSQSRESRSTTTPKAKSTESCWSMPRSSIPSVRFR